MRVVSTSTKKLIEVELDDGEIQFLIDELPNVSEGVQAFIRELLGVQMVQPQQVQAKIGPTVGIGAGNEVEKSRG